MSRVIKIATLFSLACIVCLQGSARATRDVLIQDDAGVLSQSNKAAIKQAAEPAPFAVRVVVSNGGFPGNRNGFKATLQPLVESRTVVIGLDPSDRFIEILARQDVGLTGEALAQAKAAARSQFTNKQWGAGIVTVLQTVIQIAPAAGMMRQPGSTPFRSAAPMGRMPYRTSAPMGSNPLNGNQPTFQFGGLLIIFIVIAGLVLFARKMMGMGQQGGYGQSPQQTGPGGFPINNANTGMQGGMGGMGGGLMAGGLGALGGGLLGYELGKAAGGGGNYNQGAFGQDMNPGSDSGMDSGGGIVDSDMGAGNTPDFGGDMGGGDFGGGGGGTDF